MLLTMFKGKIHRATVTEANLNYMGSVTIDKTLLEASGILPGEKVSIVNNNNGNRFETYVIEGAADSGIICLNGAAARLVHVGDTVIIIAYALMDEQQARGYTPKVVMVNSENKIAEQRSCERAGEIG